eukprot:TRINITY_DN298_c0_g2_i1.p2 TRINITY_DN298_c0_g2~~TRINITY_DN298_c0_g2_i1.p2  ORF type:complete len:121 (-),score=2.67 TRINITY_DN298_c0_g2_i1:278-640(-)
MSRGPDAQREIDTTRAAMRGELEGARARRSASYAEDASPVAEKKPPQAVELVEDDADVEGEVVYGAPSVPRKRRAKRKKSTKKKKQKKDLDNIVVHPKGAKLLAKGGGTVHSLLLLLQCC